MEIQELTEWMLWLLCPVHRSTSFSPNIPVVLIAVAMVLNDSGTLYGICTLSVCCILCEVCFILPFFTHGPKGRLFNGKNKPWDHMSALAISTLQLLRASGAVGCRMAAAPFMSLTQSEACSYLWGLGALPAFLCAQPNLQVLSPVLFLSVNIC